ncbi:MAG: hypothetical protein V1721_01455 [Pseudomonadota bacterium]
MADAPSIPPFPPATPVVSAVAPQLTLAGVSVQQAPAELTRPEFPAIVEGRVISSDPQAQQIRIQTKMGEVVVQSAVNLPPDTEVSVRVYTDKNRTLADIAVLRQTIVPPLQPEVSVPLPLLQEGQTVTAFLLPELRKPEITPVSDGDEGKRPSVSVPDSLPKTPELSFRRSVVTEGSPFFSRKEISVASPGMTKNDGFRQTAGSSGRHRDLQDAPMRHRIPELVRHGGGEIVRNDPELPPETIFSPQSSDFRFPSSDFRMHILKIFPPDAPPEKIKIALQKTGTSAPMLARVETTTSGGSPILKTSDSHFVVRTPVSVPVGSVIIFESGIVTPETGIQDISSFPPSGLPVPGDTWPALREALQILSSSASPAAQAFRNTIPTLTPRLVPTALFFLAALRLGSINGWLGDNTLGALRQAGKKELAERLGSDFGKLSGMSKETLADGWRSISMPLLHDEQLSRMQFYVRRQYDGDGGDKEDGAKPATRFILNLHLSRMGEMQLDGFIRKKNFDVILRTAEKLPFDMRRELMQRFAQGLEQVRMQGKISFQTRQKSWITVSLPQQAGVVL